MKVFNSLSRDVEEFNPIDSKNVKMYVCGITPYDTTHLGHAFTYIFFDTLIRYLKYTGCNIIYTQNVTDINDRDSDILKRANEQGIPWQNLANFWTDKFLDDMHKLNWIMPDHFLWASAHIPSMVKLTNQLLENGFAYVENGGVYLDIAKIRDYGKLSKLTGAQMLNVAREFGEDLHNPDKKYPLDITLWRPTVAGQPIHIPSFDSPFGPGRPGWHLECSAMANCSLGEKIDIHGGGIDLIYPHHESEIIQSEGATGVTPFAKYWIHTELVSYKGQKMSKSLGNLVMVSDLLVNHSANAIRYILLSHHYRSPWEFTESELDNAETKINFIRGRINNKTNDKSKVNKNLIEKFENAMDDDMNTKKALEILLKAESKKEIMLMAEVLGFKF